MKLRLKFVRSNLETIFVETDTNDDEFTFEHLRSLVADNMIALEGNDNITLNPMGSTFNLSMNGRDKLQVDGVTLVRDLGIVQGDTIYVIHEDQRPTSNANSAILTSSLASIPDNEEPAENVDVMAERDTDDLDPENAYEIDNAEFKITESERMHINRYLLRPMFCRESTSEAVSELLEQTYESTTVNSSFKALYLAIHVLMLEVGFIPMKLFDDATCDEGFFKLEYTHIHHKVPACKVYIVSMGSNAICHGISGNDLFTLTVNCHHFVSSVVSSSNQTRLKANQVYFNLAKLSCMVKDKLAYPLLQSFFTGLNLHYLYGFDVLPVEVELIIIRFLDARSLVRLSTVNWEFKRLIELPEIWKRRLIIDYPTRALAAEKNGQTNWKEEYIRAHRVKVTNQRARQYRRQVFFPNPNPFPHPIVPGFDPYFPQHLPRPRMLQNEFEDSDSRSDLVSRRPHVSGISSLICDNSRRGQNRLEGNSTGMNRIPGFRYI